METQQLHHIIHAAKSIKELGHADCHILNMLHKVLDERDTYTTIIIEEVYMPLVFNAEGRERKKIRIAEAFPALSPRETLLFFHAVHIDNELQNEKKLTLL